MTQKVCAGEDISQLATRVAERLAKVHGVDAAPAACAYRIDPVTAAAHAPRVAVIVDPGKGLAFDVHTCLGSDRNHSAVRGTPVERLACSIAMLHDFAADLAGIRRMAIRRIDKARASGLPCRLISAEPGRLDADWAEFPHVKIGIEAIDPSLRLGRESYHACRARDFAWHMDVFERSQADRMAARAFLAGHGATAAIDAVLLNALRHAGIPDADLLRRLRNDRAPFIDIVGADGTPFHLCWTNGRITGQVALGDGVTWREGCLRLEHAPRRYTRRDIGRPLVDLHPHPLLVNGMMVTHASGKRDSMAYLTCAMKLVGIDLDNARLCDKE